MSLKASELAEKLNVTCRTIRNWAHSGEIPIHKKHPMRFKYNDVIKSEVIKNYSQVARSKAENKDSYLTTSQLKDRLPISIHTVKRWVHKKIVPYIKLGHDVYFNPKAVKSAFIASGKKHYMKYIDYL